MAADSETAISTTLAPPVLGVNTVDPISAMDPRYAIEADNYFSDGRTVDIRKGYRYFAKNIGTTIPGNGWAVVLFEFPLQDGTRKLIALSSGLRLYNITAGGGSPTDLSNGGTRLTGADSQAVVFNNRIFFKDVQGATALWSWDGAAAAVTAPGFTGPSGGETAMKCPAVYKGRLYFAGSTALSIWYGGFQAITGTLTEFSVQSFLQLGGKIRFCGAISRTGQGVEDYFVIITSEGEVLLYQGDNPGDSTWYLVGRYFMPPPLDEFAFCYWGTNLVIVTYQGVILLNDVLSGNNDLTFLSEKINNEVVEYIETQTTPFVAPTYFAAGNMIIFTFVDDQVGGENYQWVMSTTNGSWWKWSGISTVKFTVYDNELYFGTNSDTEGGVVYKAWNGYFDESGTSGAVATRDTKLRCAFNYLDDRQRVKTPVQAVPILYESEGLSLTLDCDIDYSDTASTSTVTDTTDTSYKLYKPVCGLTAPGPGKAISIRLDGTVTTKRRSIQAIEVYYKSGGQR